MGLKNGGSISLKFVIWKVKPLKSLRKDYNKNRLLGVQGKLSG